VTPIMMESNRIEDLSLFCSPSDGGPLSTLDANECIAADGTTYVVTEDGIPLFAADFMSDDARVQEEHYDRVAEAYVANLAYPHTQEYMGFLDRVLDESTGSKGLGTVAEICCGHAEAIHRYHDRIDVAVGIDISTEMLRVAQRENAGPRRYFVQGDATRMPLASARFDTVFMLGGIHHVNDRAGLFSEIARILNPGGRFIFREPLNDLLPWRILRAMVYRWSPALDADTERPLRWKETVPLLEQVDISVDRWRTEGFIGFCLFMNSDVLVVNRWLRFLPGIRVVTRGFVQLDRATRYIPGLKNGGLQVICTAVKGSSP
jgi:SAM-dependent methyltransferase